MLINNNARVSEHIEFISYSGHYPNLCGGVLILKIDGANYKFGHNLSNYDFKTHEFKNESDHYEKFWCSDGGFDSKGYTDQKDWIIDVAKIPEQSKKYASEIDKVFNENVEHGCCGGCD